MLKDKNFKKTFIYNPWKQKGDCEREERDLKEIGRETKEGNKNASRRAYLREGGREAVTGQIRTKYNV